MNLWNMAYDALPNEDELGSVEERIAAANVLALLAIGQELSVLNHGESKLGKSAVDLAKYFTPASATAKR